MNWTWLVSQIKEHWKTTSVGAVLSVFLSFVLFAPDMFPVWLRQLAAFAAIGGAAALGIVAHDPRKEQ